MATNPNVTQFPLVSTTAQPAPIKGRPLAKKLAMVMSEVHRVPKNGRNDFHNYDYVTESDLVDHIRDKLAQLGVALFPSVREHEVVETEDQRKRTVYLTTVTLDITLVDGESGDMMTTSWVGQGMDQGDKGYYKAYTGALKYFLLKTFMISTGDDPERDDHLNHQPPQPRSQAPAKASAPEPQNGPTLPEPKFNSRAQEFEHLLAESVDDTTKSVFLALYIQRMGASDLDEIGDQKIGAMCRKLRAMDIKARKDYVLGVIAENRNGK